MCGWSATKTNVLSVFDLFLLGVILFFPLIAAFQTGAVYGFRKAKKGCDDGSSDSSS